MHETLGDGYVEDGGKRVYADENPATGREATQFRHQEANSFQEEIANVIRDAGITLNSAGETISQMNQLNTAITQKINAAKAAMQVIINALTTDDIINESGVSGGSCSDVLNFLADDINTLQSALSDLQNTVDDLDSGDIDNASTVTGGDVTAALDNLSNLIAGLTSDDIGNESTIGGDSVTTALSTLHVLFDDYYDKVDSDARYVQKATSDLAWKTNLLTLMGSTLSVGSGRSVTIDVSTTPGWTNLDVDDMVTIIRRGNSARWQTSSNGFLRMYATVISASSIQVSACSYNISWQPAATDTVTVYVKRKLS